jgi:hypothetical protein
MKFEIERVQVQNVVASGSFDQPIDLQTVTKAFPDAKPLRENHRSRVVRISNVWITVFPSGKINCVGAKSQEELSEAIQNVAQKLRENGAEISAEPSMKTVNVVASGTLKWILDSIETRVSGSVLDQLMTELPIFHLNIDTGNPIAILRIRRPPFERPPTAQDVLVFEIFESGKFNCQNVQREGEIYDVLRALQLAISSEDSEARNKVIQASVTSKSYEDYVKEIGKFLEKKVGEKTVFEWKDSLDFSTAYDEYLRMNALPDIPKLKSRVKNVEYFKFLFNERERTLNRLVNSLSKKLKASLEKQGIADVKKLKWKEAAKIVHDFLQKETSSIPSNREIRSTIASRLLYAIKKG